MPKSNPKYYEDFIIGTPTRLFYIFRPLVSLMALTRRQPKASYYGTSVRRVGKSKVELTFDLPPTVKQRMEKAVASGKQIRLFVL